MKRLLRNSIYVFIIAAVFIAASQVYEAKDSVLPGDYPDKVAGITPHEKLNNLLKQWNKIGETEGYKVSGRYKEELVMNERIVKIDLFITFLFDYFPQPGAYLNKVNDITGKIIIPTAKIFKPLDKITVALDFKPGKSPPITINAISLQGKQIEDMRKKNLKDWTIETYANQGELCTDENGKAAICIPPGEPLALP